MEHRVIVGETLGVFARALRERERSLGTIEKYLRNVRTFSACLGEEEVSREKAVAWRHE